MSVASHSYVGLGGGRVEVVDGKHAGHSQRGLVACRKMEEHF